MSFYDDYATWQERIENVSEKEMKLPRQPIDEFAGQCETLAMEAAEDRAELEAAGLNAELIDEVASLTGALRHLQANWMSVYHARQDAQKEWQQQSPLAYELRNELLHHFTFAYRNDKNLLQKVRRIREGSSHADMIQDLVELAVLGEKNPEPLTKIHYDMLVLDQAKTMSQSMSVLLATANGSADESNTDKVLRDKAYTLLEDKVSTIREYGRYVFWKNEDKLERYSTS